MWQRHIRPIGDAFARLSANVPRRVPAPRFFTTHSEAPTKSKTLYNVVGVSSLAILGSGLYYGYHEGMIPLLSANQLEQMDETKFDSADDLVVVLLRSRRPKDYPKAHVDKIKSILPKGVKLCYAVKEGVDPTKPPLMLYKGLRKQFYATTDMLDKSQFEALESEMAEFFKPVSQDIATLRKDPRIPEYVTYDTFQDKVVKEATASAPILLQLYEESCFLCFLMRPFINSVNRHLEEVKSPVRIKRLNIERNDFPKGCPVTRATPTFVMYSGRPEGVKWAEFKPQDFVRRLVEVAKLDNTSKLYLERLTEDVSRRFMLFGRWARWISQSQLAQEKVLTKGPVDEEDVQSRVLKALIDLDMDRTDDLETNLKLLEREIVSAEQDCLAVAQIIMEEVIKDEKQHVKQPKRHSNEA
ncbi:thioredoxin-like protein [Babesia caballi]|uniref:Thioredoxin-like protein n=1 Tax=Babesia caballi TaxID=5871 RepID=A0AAV4M0K5_BABCB|nr:thioredoxin-like protein [Babesia caballi]